MLGAPETGFNLCQGRGRGAAEAEAAEAAEHAAAEEEVLALANPNNMLPFPACEGVLDAGAEILAPEEVPPEVPKPAVKRGPRGP